MCLRVYKKPQTHLITCRGSVNKDFGNKLQCFATQKKNLT